MQRALVTGARGFLGSHLIDRLVRNGVQVTALTRGPGPEPWYVTMGEAPWCSDTLAEIVESARPDVIFHLAGGAAASAQQVENVNVGLTCSLLTALRRSRIRPLLVCCGSAAEYGTAAVDAVPISEDVHCAPTSAYGCAKLAQTRAALAFAEETGAAVLVGRIFNPVGPGMPGYLAIGDFARQIAMMPDSGGTLHTGALDRQRDFMDARDVVSTLVTLAERPNARGVVNICSGHATALKDLVDLLIAASGKSVAVEVRRDRLRRDDLAVMVGSTARLASFGALPLPTNFGEVMVNTWADAQRRWSAS